MSKSGDRIETEAITKVSKHVAPRHYQVERVTGTSKLSVFVFAPLTNIRILTAVL